MLPLFLLPEWRASVILVVKELYFMNVRSVEALHMAEYVPSNEDPHTLPHFDQ
jgi:hypothetical protein